ncbi:MAG: type II toxin-antitoxin system RelB/DinJ family antitoxin [bacterium]|nr:type II toxin-antitoxin system RelB/DinJ family antitoxin [bacterium]
MSKYAVINLKTDPELKKRAAKAADKLGISVSAVLNNELRRFATEQSVTFDVPEVPNAKTAKELAASRKQIEAGDYHKFKDNDEALDFLANKLNLK